MNFLDSLVNQAKQKKKQIGNVVQGAENGVRDVFDANTQADQQRRATAGQPRSYQQQQASLGNPSNLYKLGTGIGLGGVRSATGDGQFISGLYDLITPGHGTNRISQSLDRFAKNTDLTAQNEGINPMIYRGGQFGTDALSFAVGAGEAKVAANAAMKAPGVAKAASPLIRGADVLHNATVNPLARLEAKGIGGRVAARTARGAIDPANNAANLLMTAKQTGEQASKGRDINANELAKNLAVGTAFNVGLPLAGALTHEGALAGGRVIARAPQVTQRAGKAVNTKLTPKQFQITPEDHAALTDYSNMMNSRYLPDQGGYDVATQNILARKAFDISKKTGLDITGGPANVASRVDQYLQDFQKHQDSILQGGYAKIPNGKNDPAPELHPEQKDYINNYANTLESIDQGNKGGYMVPDGNNGYTRASDHSQFYKDTFARTGKAPTKLQWYDEARRQLETGDTIDGSHTEYQQLAQHTSDVQEVMTAAKQAAKSGNLKEAQMLAESLPEAEQKALLKEVAPQPTPEAPKGDIAKRYQLKSQGRKEYEPTVYKTREEAERIAKDNPELGYTVREVKVHEAPAPKPVGETFQQSMARQKKEAATKIEAMAKKAQSAEELQNMSNGHHYNAMHDYASPETKAGLAKLKQGVDPNRDYYMKKVYEDYYNHVNRSSSPKPTLQDALAGKSTKVKKPEPEKTISKFPNRLLEEDRTELIHTTLLQNVTHDVKHNKDVLEQTGRNIANNEDSALSFAKRGSSTEANATALQLLNKYLDEGNFEKAGDLVKAVSPRFTRQGQETQILAAYSKLTPAGAVRYASKEIDKAVEKLGKGKGIEDKTAEAHKAVQDTAKDIAKQLETELSTGKIARKAAKTVSEKEPKTPEQMLADRIKTGISQKKNGPDPIKDMVDTLHKVAKEVIPDQLKSTPRDPMQLIGKAIKDKAQYKDVWEKAQKLVAEKYKDNPHALEELDKYFSSSLARPFSKGQLRRGVQQGLKGVDLGKIVREHYTTVDATGKELADKLIERAGLSKGEAAQLAGDIQGRYNQLVKERKESIIKQMFGERPTPKQRNAADRILTLHNLGAMSRDELRPLVGEKLGVPTLTSDMAKHISGMAEKIQSLPEGGKQRLRATAEMMKYISDNIPQSTAKNVLGVWKAGLLSGTKTMLGNPLSNEAFYGLKEASDPLSTLFDKGLTVAGKTKAGKKLGLTGDRSYTTSHKDVIKGTKEGFGTATDTFKTGIDMRNVIAGDKYEQRSEINFGSNVWQKVFGAPANRVFRAMSSADQPVYYRTLRQELNRQAKVDGMNQGLRGQALRDYTSQAVKNPTQHMAEVAKQAADKSVLGQDNAVASALSHVTQKIPAAQTVIPFTKVPTNFLSRSLDYTPAGAIKELTKQAIRVRKSEGIDQRALSQALGEATTGTAVIFMGATLANNKLLSGQYPQSDPKEAQRWKVEKITPNSVKIGNKWVNLNYLGPAGLLLGAGKDYQDALAQGDDKKAAAIASAAGAGKNLTGQSFLSGLSGFTNAINDPQRSAKSYINSQASSVVPSWINDIANLTDKNQRQADTTAEAVKNRIPGAREFNKVKQDVYGNPLIQPAGRLNTINPLKPSNDLSKKNSVVSEVNRLHNVDPNNKDLQVTPTAVQKTVKLKDQTIKLNNKQAYDLQTQVGQATQKAWGNLIKTPEYKALDDAGKAQALSGMRSDAASAAQRQYVAANNLGEYAKSPTAKVQDFMDGTPVTGSYTAPKSTTGSTKDKSFSDQLQAARKNYQEKKSSMSRFDQYKAEDNIKSLEVKQNFTKGVVGLYGSGMSKQDVYDYLTKDPDGTRVAKDLVAYGDALVNAGLTSTNKYRLKNGTVSIRPKAKSSSSGGSKKSITTLINEFKLPYGNEIKNRTKGAQLARSAGLAKKA